MKILTSRFFIFLTSILFSWGVKFYAKAVEISPIQQLLDTYVEKHQSNDKFTGHLFTLQCPLYNYNDGEVTTFNSGLQNVNGVPVDNDSLFQIGSNTKSFVAVVILQLESEQKLSLENTVDDFFPNEYPKWKNITVKQLLNMTSGIQNYFMPEVPIWQEIREKPYNTFTTDDLLNSVKNLDLTFTPGTKWNYSNTNYVLAGKIIEKVTSLSPAEEIENRIIKPLHLKHTYYIKSFPKEEISSTDLSHLMSGYYTFADYILKPYYTYGQDISDYSMSMFNAAGAIISTSSDLNAYIQTLFSTNPNQRLLPQRQLNELISLVDMTDGSPLPDGVNIEHSEGYGLGIIGTYDKSVNTMFYQHGGGTYGFLSTWHYLPKEKASFVYAINNSMPSETFNAELLDPLVNIFYQNCLMQ